MTREQTEQFVRDLMLRREPWAPPDEEQVRWGAELLLWYEQVLQEGA